MTRAAQPSGKARAEPSECVCGQAEKCPSGPDTAWLLLLLRSHSEEKEEEEEAEVEVERRRCTSLRKEQIIHLDVNHDFPNRKCSFAK